VFASYFEGFLDTPPDIAWFERLWLATLALSVVVTIMMFDWSVSRVGPYGAALLTATRFGGTYLVMAAVSLAALSFAFALKRVSPTVLVPAGT